MQSGAEGGAGMEKSDYQKEAEYFDRVEGIIKKKLGKLYESKTSLREQVVRERRDMWDENRHGILEFDDVILLSTQEHSVSLAEKQYEQNALEIQRLSKMEKSPYFGSVDFEESETGEGDRIYIGIYSLTEEESYEIYVVDWRAPIASMFYQFDSGPAWYEVHGHRREVGITGKRQYKIEEGRLLSVYDTNSSMYDDILGEVLSNHTDHKLKAIVGSIQKEQNAAIRSDIRRSCLIYGLAGSGKTSIGLHRLAYILYQNREEMPSADAVSAENIVILSNNGIFESYISSILPDLGEKAAETKVFADLLEEFMGRDMKIEDYYTQLKRIEEDPDDERIKWLQVKYSADMIQYCIDYFASYSFQIPEIRYREEIIISPKLLQSKMSDRQFSEYRSGYERLNYLVRKTIEEFFFQHKEEICDDIVESHDENLFADEVKTLYNRMKMEYIQSAQEEIRRLNKPDSGEQMEALLSDYLHRMREGDEEAERLFCALNRGRLWYEDALLYLFVRVLTGEVKPFTKIRHVVIDEVQDYNLLQLYLVKYLFPRSSFTLLGDIYQTVNSVTTIQEYDVYERVFGSDLISIRLSKCYRSSSDINALAFGLINEKGHPIGEYYSYFERPVKKPQYVICGDMLSCLVPILEQLEKYHSVAIIVNHEEEALLVKSHLDGQKEAQLIISPADELKSRLVIIPLLLAKGLEFDAVILFNCIYANQGKPYLRRRVYLGCTRALHELYFVEREALPDSLRECGSYMEIREL